MTDETDILSLIGEDLKKKLCKCKCFCAIVKKDMEEETLNLLHSSGVIKLVIVKARGTAQPGVMDFLGIRDTERSFIMGIIRKENVEPTIQLLNEKLNFHKPGTGIAFTVPVDAHTGVKSLFRHLEKKLETEANHHVQ